MGKSLRNKAKTPPDDRKKTTGKPRSRRLATLGAIRKELVKLYAELKDSQISQSKMKVQYYRALTFILSSAADVLRSEKFDDIEKRIEELERIAEDKARR